MINIENLHFNYSRKPQLFSGLDLQLHPGRIYGLLGKNGTGKSTLLKLIQGVIFPKAGHIEVDGHLSKARKPAMLQEIFFLTEEYELPSININNYLKAYRPFYPKFDEVKFYRLLEGFEIERNSKLTELSYGQKKKVLISFALATNCRYLLMDEPTNGLDIPSKRQFRKAMLTEFRDDQIVIISTHQIRDLNQLLESVVIIEGGKILFNQSVTALEDKLSFVTQLSAEPVADSIYVDRVAGGYLHVVPNVTGTPSEIDLEVLFNAVLVDQQTINAQFQN